MCSEGLLRFGSSLNAANVSFKACDRWLNQACVRLLSRGGRSEGRRVFSTQDTGLTFIAKLLVLGIRRHV